MEQTRVFWKEIKSYGTRRFRVIICLLRVTRANHLTTKREEEEERAERTRSGLERNVLVRERRFRWRVRVEVSVGGSSSFPFSPGAISSSLFRFCAWVTGETTYTRCSRRVPRGRQRPLAERILNSGEKEKTSIYRGGGSPDKRATDSYDDR